MLEGEYARVCLVGLGGFLLLEENRLILFYMGRDDVQ